MTFDLSDRTAFLEANPNILHVLESADDIANSEIVQYLKHLALMENEMLAMAQLQRLAAVIIMAVRNEVGESKQKLEIQLGENSIFIGSDALVVQSANQEGKLSSRNYRTRAPGAANLALAICIRDYFQAYPFATRLPFARKQAWK